MTQHAHTRNERRTREERNLVGDGKELPPNFGISWCGKSVDNRWHFMDAAHVLGALQGGTGIQPCTQCLIAMRRVIDAELGIREAT